MCTLKASHYKDAPKIMIYRDVTINEGNKRDYQANTQRDGGQQGWIYSVDGLMSTIPSSCYKDPPKIVVEKEQKNDSTN